MGMVLPSSAARLTEQKKNIKEELLVLANHQELKL
jgi:hypothetical protein